MPQNVTGIKNVEMLDGQIEEFATMEISGIIKMDSQSSQV